MTEARIRDAQRFFLDAHVLPGLFDQLFEGANSHVSPRDFGAQRDERVLVVVNGAHINGLLLLDGSAVLAPEVRFPRCVKTDLLIPVMSSEIRWSVNRIVAETYSAYARRHVGLRILIADGDAERGPGFHDPKSRNLQRQVLTVGELDQSFKRWIVEGFPPCAVRRSLRRDLWAGHAPIVIYLQHRLFVVRPYRATSQRQRRAQEHNGR